MSSQTDTQQQSDVQNQMAAKRRRGAAAGVLVLGLVGLVLACWQIYQAAAEPGLLQVVSSLVFFLLALVIAAEGFRRLKASR